MTAKKSKMTEALELFAKWASELKPGESLTIYSRATPNAVTLYNHAQQPMTRATGGGYDRAGACLEALFKVMPGGQGNADLLGWSGTDKAETEFFRIKKILWLYAPLNLNVWTITRK